MWILLKQESVSASGISWIYANLHLAPGRKSHQHPTAQFLLFFTQFFLLQQNPDWFYLSGTFSPG